MIINGVGDKVVEKKLEDNHANRLVGVNWSSKITEFIATDANNTTTKEKSYTAERDCYLKIEMRGYGSSGASLYIDNVLIKNVTGTSSNNHENLGIIPIKKGQTVKGTGNDGLGSYVKCTFYDVL